MQSNKYNDTHSMDQEQQINVMKMMDSSPAQCAQDCLSVTDQTTVSSGSSSSRPPYDVCLGMEDAMAATSSNNFRKLHKQVELAMSNSSKNPSDDQNNKTENLIGESSMNRMLKDIDKIKGNIDNDSSHQLIKRHSDHTSLEDILIDENGMDITQEVFEIMEHDKHLEDEILLELEKARASQKKEKRPSILGTISSSIRLLSSVGNQSILNDRLCRSLSTPQVSIFSCDTDSSDPMTEDIKSQNSSKKRYDVNDKTNQLNLSSKASKTNKSSAKEQRHQVYIQDVHSGSGNILSMSQHEKNGVEEHFVCEEELESGDFVNNHSKTHTFTNMPMDKKHTKRQNDLYQDIASGKRRRRLRSSFEIKKQNEGGRKNARRDNFFNEDLFKTDRRSPRYAIILFFILTLVIIACITVLNRQPQKDERESSFEEPAGENDIAIDNPQIFPTTFTLQTNDTINEIKSSILPLLETISDKPELTYEISAQYKAMMWIINDIRFNEESFSKYQNNREKLIQRYVLAILFFTTSGSTTGGADYNIEDTLWLKSDGWLSSLSECFWHGLTCKDDKITRMDLGNNGLQGFLPEEISHLQHLRELYLDQNTLKGGGFDYITKLTNLRVINLNKNQLDGEIPPNIRNMVNIEKLDISDNVFEGQIPSSIGNLKGLVEMKLGRNELTGNIPPAFFEMSNLQTLELDHNKLEGSLSDSINALKFIVTLRLNDNDLYGNLPVITGLSNLEELYLGGNAFSGPIPRYMFSNVLELRELSLENNYLTGSIPVELGNLKHLEILNLSDNSLSDSIPPSIGIISVLKELYLGFNSLTGTLPSTMKNQVSLERIYLNNNKLHGNIPSWIALLPNLKTLYINNNDFDGPIPSFEYAFPVLNELALENNHLTGTMGEAICIHRISVLTTDCSGSDPKVVCTCCTECFP